MKIVDFYLIPLLFFALSINAAKEPENSNRDFFKRTKLFLCEHKIKIIGFVVAAAGAHALWIYNQEPSEDNSPPNHNSLEESTQDIPLQASTAPIQLDVKKKNKEIPERLKNYTRDRPKRSNIRLISRARLKKELYEKVAKLMELRPVQFNYDAEIDPNESLQYGLIAEEVINVLPELVEVDENGVPQAVHYNLLSGIVLKALQSQQNQINQLQATVNQLTQA